MNIVLDPADMPLIVKSIEHSGVFVFDVETMPAYGDKTEKGETRGDPWRNTVVWIAVSDGHDSWVIPMGHPNGDFVESKYPLKDSAMRRIEKGLPIRPQDYSTDPKKEIRVFTDAPVQMTRTEVFAALKPLFMDDQILKVGHNLGFDLGSVTKYVGAIPEGPYFDTMIAAFLIDSDRGFGFGLKDIAKKYADIDMEKGVGARIEQHGFIEVAKYAALDVEATTSLLWILSDRIESDGLSKVMRLEMDVLRVVTDMRLVGAVIDTASLSALKDRLERDIEEAKGRVFLIAGEEFNLNSTSAKQRLLFDKKANGGRGLTPKTLTPGGKVKSRNKQPLTMSDYSVSAEALEGYRSTDPLVDAILEYQDLNKLHSTYVMPYMGGTVTRTTNGKARQHTKVALMDKGRLHTDFNQIGAATGRFSSRNPNLQNVPHPGSEYGKLIRNLFVAPEGHRLVVADYSQIEPRLIASFSKDPVMLDTYMNGGDIYTAIGDIMGVDRKAGKVLVLSIAYGVGPDKISRQIDCSVDEAKSLLEEFAHRFKNITRLKALTIRTAKKKTPVPYVVTLAGRRRYLPELNSEVWWQVAKAERQAFNTLIQGSAADIMKIAMVKAYNEVPEEAQVILTVHDELVTVTPAEIAEETAESIRAAMENIRFLKVPLLADVKIVDRWGEAK